MYYKYLLRLGDTYHAPIQRDKVMCGALCGNWYFQKALQMLHECMKCAEKKALLQGRLFKIVCKPTSAYPILLPEKSDCPL